MRSRRSTCRRASACTSWIGIPSRRGRARSIKETSRTAMEEVRSVLGVIRNDGDAPLAPQAELAELPRLVAGVRSPGFDAELVDRLDGAVPGRAAQFAAYRIAQEALTNVVRHAGATRPWSPSERLGRRAPRHRRRRRRRACGGSPEGSGIPGMRERAALSAGPSSRASPRGGIRVTARLPWGGDARDPGRAGRRPTARACRIPRAAPGRGRHRGGRRGVERRGAARARSPGRGRRRTHGHPHARRRRAVGDQQIAAIRRSSACAW